ncbi:hypothetical protein TNCV_1740801 [Trichonephila clavipes]|uniref:Uncharacterized protein n=1 Tax=Trichonephila clavipes TaxID=2585209 RepID=A0A8X6RKK7_TRICX|nr:hypothetical protein TNCV_1740801 [Trichonephila clavipes]
MGGEFTSGGCISIGKGNTIGRFRGISDFLGKVISLLIAEDVPMGQYPLQAADSWGCKYYKGLETPHPEVQVLTQSPRP